MHAAPRSCDTFKAADQALYEAKRDGRDRLVLEAPPPVEELAG